MLVNLYSNGYLIAQIKVNNETAVELQNCGFVLEKVNK
jgi:hypothetical protein